MFRLLQGFVKRDRKREAESMPPEVEDATANGDPKRSTEWTLTDEAITGGVQSTTRYRNKKNDRRVRDRHHHGGAANHALYHPSEHTLRHGPPANRFAPPRNREFPGRVSKAHRHGGQGLRMAPTSGFIARTSSPYYQDAFLAQAMAGQTQPLKMDPSMMALPPSSAAAGPDGYGMMIPDHQNMMHGGNGQVPSMYLGPPPPPHGPFPYDTTDVSLSYPGTEGATDANRSARLFDAAHMQDGFCEWSTGDHGY